MEVVFVKCSESEKEKDVVYEDIEGERRLWVLAQKSGEQSWGKWRVSKGTTLESAGIVMKPWCCLAALRRELRRVPEHEHEHKHDCGLIVGP